MPSIQILANITAVLFSFTGIISLFSFSRKLVGDTFSNVIKLIVWGIFFAVFIHSIVELLDATKIINEDTVAPLMSLLLSIGSAFFAFAGRAGLKIIKD